MAQAILSIKTFGAFQVHLDNVLLLWPTQKSKLLLQILLLEPGAIVNSERLVDLLWPDLAPGSAKSNLWVTVSQLRRVLEPNLSSRGHSEYLHKAGDGYQFNRESAYQLDSNLFTTLLRQAKSSVNVSDRLQLWEKAAHLYTGDYLAEEIYAEWLASNRYQWQQSYLQILTSLAEAYMQVSDLDKAISYCRQYLQYDDISETVSRMLMFCLNQQGERSAALTYYQQLATKLTLELGVEPLPETRALAQQIKEGRSAAPGSAQRHTQTNDNSARAPLAGREIQLAQMGDRWAEVIQGRGHILLVTGEAGIGKSRLAQELRVMAGGQGAYVLQARCYEIEQGIAYQPLIDLLQQAVAQGSHSVQMPAVWQRELAVIMPEFKNLASSAAAPVPFEDESQQARLYQAIFRFLKLHAANRPIAIIIDDIQWADNASLGFLHFLARQGWQDKILLLCTYRSEEISLRSELAQLVEHLRRQENSSLIELSRLTAAEIKAYVHLVLPEVADVERLSTWLFQETEGNPFFLITLLLSLSQGNHIVEIGEKLRQTSLDPDLPEAITNFVRARLHALSPQERQLLDRLAVYGRSLDFATLSAVSSQAQMVLLDSLERLLARQLLVEADNQYQFSHDKVREVIYQELSGARRLVYHGQIANLLAVDRLDPGSAAAIANHYQQAGEVDRATTYWLAAGHHDLSVYALSQAITHFQKALSLAHEPGAFIEAYNGLGRGYMLLEASEESVAHFRQGIVIARRQEDLKAEARLLHGLAVNLGRRHLPDASIKDIEIAMAAAEKAEDDHLLVQCLLLLTEAHEANGSLTSALKSVSRAESLSSKMAYPMLQSQSLLESAFLNTLLSNFNEAITQTKQALDLAKAPVDDANAAYAWNILGRAYGGSGSYAEAFDAFTRCHTIASRMGDGYLLSMIPNMHGWLHRELGDFTAALAFDEAGVRLAQQWRKSPPEISARLNVCHDLLKIGKVVEAKQMLADVATQFESGSFGFHRWRWQLRWNYISALCHLALGDYHLVTPLIQDGLELATEHSVTKYLALNQELAGMLAASHEQYDQSQAAWQKAVTIADQIGLQPIRWQGRFQLAKILQHSGQSVESDQLLLAAESITTRIAGGLANLHLENTFRQLVANHQGQQFS